MLSYGCKACVRSIPGMSELYVCATLAIAAYSTWLFFELTGDRPDQQ